MFPLVDTKDPTAVEVAVQSAYLAMFPRGDRLLVPRAFGWVIDCFLGNYRGYQPIDALYHDLEHSLQGTLCFARLLHGRHKAGVRPRLTQKMFELGLLSILTHDTGYLKVRGDNSGTGAKYTLIHVSRSAEFAKRLLIDKGFSTWDAAIVQRMIRCTGVNVKLSKIPFHQRLERIVGFALGTADILGQMAAPDYVEKLPILYLEFAESARHDPGPANPARHFTSAKDMLRKTPGFWDNYVLPKIKNDFEGQFKFLNSPYPDGPNEYLQRVEKNIARLRG